MTSPAPQPDTATLRVSGASKTFSGTKVLDSISFTLGAGEITALIGENGSGKSTLIKILSGFHTPDPGIDVAMAGHDISGVLHGGAARTGMAFIHQDLALVPSMTIVENLRINRFTTGAAGRIRWREERALVSAALRRVGLDVSPDRTVGDLSVTERALVAIARGVAEIDESGHDGQLLVLDEPTAYLPHAGVERLFGVLRDLAASGTSILFVSHRLDEVLALCHRVMVLRNGRMVTDEPVAGHTSRSLVELMLGQKAEDMYPTRTRPDGPTEPVLTVTGLSGQFADDVSFTASPGDIVGFVGLPGGGYDEIPYLLSGASPSTSGRVEVAGRGWDAAGTSPKSALERGLAMLPADRKGSGGALTLTAAENMTLPTLGQFTRWRTVLQGRGERTKVLAQMGRFAVRPQRPDLALALMSGGNQQKVLLAKWVMAGPKVLALHEPTQGVDIGAKREVFAHLAALAAEGTVVLVSSVEYEDLAHLCDRVHVLSHGRIVRTISGEELTAHEVAAAVYA